MKRLGILVALALLSGCEPRQPLHITGYLVGKEIIPEHMSNETPKHIQVATVIVVPHPATPPPPHKVERQMIWHVATAQNVYHVTVENEARFFSRHVGDTVHVTIW